MFERFANGAVVIALLAAGAACLAAEPMTPVRPLSPPRTAGDWIEPPPAKPKAAPAARTARLRSTPEGDTASPGPASAGNETADAKPLGPPTRLASKGHRRRPAARGIYLASRSYPPGDGGWSGSSMPYTPGPGPAPYSASGN